MSTKRKTPPEEPKNRQKTAFRKANKRYDSMSVVVRAPI